MAELMRSAGTCSMIACPSMSLSAATVPAVSAEQTVQPAGDEQGGLLATASRLDETDHRAVYRHSRLPGRTCPTEDCRVSGGTTSRLKESSLQLTWRR